MPKIRAFRAYTYNDTFKKKLEDLISPPYDVIKEDERKALLSKNPHNSVKLCLVEDAEDPDRYRKMKKVFEDWKSQKVLVQNQKPAFYLLEETYTIEGVKKQRIGFVGLLEVTPFENKEVLPHEFTLSGPKKDRLELLKTMGAEFSQVFLVYEDPQLVLEQIYEKKSRHDADLESKTSAGADRRVWFIDDADSISRLEKLLDKKDALIADGHHRYETALEYRKQSGGEASKYLQCYFTNAHNPNFSILPIHRLTDRPASISVSEFRQSLEKSYELTVFSSFDAAHKKLEEVQDSGRSYICSVNSGAEHWLLTRKLAELQTPTLALQKDIFEGVFGWDISKISKGIIQFEHTTSDYIEYLGAAPDRIGFFLPPPKLELIKEIVLQGERMPQKSTFFYPKIASGLVIYELGSI